MNACNEGRGDRKEEKTQEATVRKKVGDYKPGARRD